MSKEERIIQKQDGTWVKRNIQDTPFEMTAEHLDYEIGLCDRIIDDLISQKKEIQDKKKSFEALKASL